MRRSKTNVNSRKSWQGSSQPSNHPAGFPLSYNCSHNWGSSVKGAWELICTALGKHALKENRKFKSYLPPLWAISLVEKHRTHNAEIGRSNRSWPIGVGVKGHSLLCGVGSTRSHNSVAKKRVFHTNSTPVRDRGLVGYDGSFTRSRSAVRTRPIPL